MILVFIYVATTWALDYPIRMVDIGWLHFRAGDETKSRRVAAVPQLSCSGELCREEFMPWAVHCINRGSDGSSVRWQCDAQLDIRVKFGVIEVNCEGFDHEGDQNVLMGSCGLKYIICRASIGLSSFWFLPGWYILSSFAPEASRMCQRHTVHTGRTVSVASRPVRVRSQGAGIASRPRVGVRHPCALAQARMYRLRLAAQARVN